jgi:DNA-binding MltR family transcriptional regulator
MARVPRSITSLSRLIREHPTLTEIFAMSDPSALDALDDRSLAILQAADLEYALERAIRCRMIDLTDTEAKEIFVGDSAPLATFSAKIKIGYALGIYGANTKSELDRMKAIRNVFAHARKPFKFSTPEIKMVCSKLTSAELPARPTEFYEKSKPWPPIDPRDRYIATAATLGGSLLLSMYDPKHGKPADYGLPPLD